MGSYENSKKTSFISKKNLRKKLRQTRRALNKSYRKHAAYKLAHTLKHINKYDFSKRVALYLEADGEIATFAIIKDLTRRKRSVFVPLIDHVRPHSLRFVRLDKNTQLKVNRFGLLEPKFVYKKIVPSFSLSMMLVPLVGFNQQAQRLGMGGGFYDRTLVKNAPTSVGLAYECQKCEHLPQASWDVAMDYIATEKQLYKNPNNA